MIRRDRDDAAGLVIDERLGECRTIEIVVKPRIDRRIENCEVAERRNGIHFVDHRDLDNVGTDDA